MLPGYRTPTRTELSDRDRIIFEGIYVAVSAASAEIIITQIEEKVQDQVTVS